MKEEVLKKMNEFKDTNLQGISLENQDLSCENFSKSTIQSTKFTNAILIAANFTQVRTGLQKRWFILLIIISCLLSGLSGFFSILTVDMFSGLFLFFEYHVNDVAPFLVNVISFIFFVNFTIRRGLNTGTLIIAILVPFTIPITIILNNIINEFLDKPPNTAPLAVASVGILSLAGIVVGLVVEAIAVAVAGAVIETFSIVVVITVVGAVIGTITGVINAGLTTIFAFIGSIVVTVPVAIVGTFIGRRALDEDKRDAWIINFAMACTARFGTSFRRADLTNANFSGTNLKNCDAILKGLM